MTNLIVNLPFFPGFYDSILSGLLDSAEERESEYAAEKEQSAEYYPESYWPESMQLDSGEHAQIMFDCMSYGDAYREMASDYCESFDNWMNDNFETPLDSFKFESMDSPREYNFRTDRVYVTVSMSVMQKLWQGINREKLAETIEARHKSRDGFISFYEHDIESWLERIESDGLESLDHNELGTLLCAAIAETVESESDFNWTICEPIAETDYEYVDKHCDWQAYETKQRQARVEKLAALMAEDCDHAARLIASHEKVAELMPMALAELDNEARNQWADKLESVAYRCPLTADMFAGETQ